MRKVYITYHRTDSLNLASAFVKSVRSYAKKTFGENYIPEKPVFYKTKGKNAQEAHEAIRPTKANNSPDKLKLTADETKVYSIIWARALGSQLMPAIYDQTSIKIISKAGYGLRASGSVIKFDGWLITGTDNADKNSHLPDIKEGEQLKLKKILPEQHFTQPPARYSDATLIKQMEEIGVGRPSTYAPTLSTIQSRGYVEKDGRYFVPKDVALVVSDLLSEAFSRDS